MKISACWRSLYDTTNAATDRTISTRTSAVTGRTEAKALRLPVLALIACSATTAACSDMFAYPIPGEIKAERIKHPRLRPSHVRDLDRIKPMSLKVKEPRGRLEILNGPSHDLAGHRFGVRHQSCHFDESYHGLCRTVDIVRMQPVMIVPGCPVRKKESVLIKFVSCKKRLSASFNLQVFVQMLERHQHTP